MICRLLRSIRGIFSGPRYLIEYRNLPDIEWRVFRRYWTYVMAQGDYWDMVSDFWHMSDVRLVRTSDQTVCRSHCAGTPKGFTNLL